MNDIGETKSLLVEKYKIQNLWVYHARTRSEDLGGTYLVFYSFDRHTRHVRCYYAAT